VKPEWIKIIENSVQNLKRLMKKNKMKNKKSFIKRIISITV